MSTLKDLTGQRLGRLVVIEKAGVSYKKEVIWKCLCECGRQTIIPGYNLRCGNTKSCGCLSAEKAGSRMRSHSLSGTRLHGVWFGMKQRCLNPNNERYHKYGGRGITICDDWVHNFQAFYDWAMENGYDENAPRGQCTIDRIDNDKGYSPDNCRWVNMKIQRHNRSDSRRF